VGKKKGVRIRKELCPVREKKITERIKKGGGGSKHRGEQKRRGSKNRRKSRRRKPAIPNKWVVTQNQRGRNMTYPVTKEKKEQVAWQARRLWGWKGPIKRGKNWGK